MNSEKFLNQKNLGKKIENLKSKRRWKAVNNQINKSELDEEEDEIDDEKFYKKFTKHQNKIVNRLQSRYDEFGTEFTPFNMREEEEDGRFDETGYFVFNKKDD